MFSTGPSPCCDDPAPDALQAGRIVAAVVLPDFPGDGLGTARVRRLGQLPADVLDLVDRGLRRHFVTEQPLVVGVFPAGVGRVVRVADTMVLDPVADLHDVFLEFLEPARKVAVDHRFGQRLVDRDDHRGILAGRIVRLVVLGLDVAARLEEPQHGIFPRPGNTIALGGQYGDSVHW